jgi:Fe-Mn family superoxide dismutase
MPTRPAPDAAAPLLTRRQTLAGVAAAGAAGAALLAVPGQAEAHAVPPVPAGPALAGQHVPRPLPFRPAALRGLSERLIRSHHEKNYGGAVKNLNVTERELARISPSTPPLLVGALRERELTFRNSKTLHELYFGNLGGDGRPHGGVARAIAQAYGSHGRWEEHLKSTAMALGGGSGWVLLSLELDTGQLRTSWSGNHTQVPALSAPLLVLDMYEHSYALDYGAAHPRYIEAFMANVQWDEVEHRHQHALRAWRALST